MLQYDNCQADDLKTYLVVWAVIFTVLFAAYSTAIALPFAYHDDYYFFAYDNRDSYMYHPQALFFLLVGREGYIPLGFLMAKFIHVVEDLSQVRLVFVALLASVGALMTRFLVRCGVNIRQGVALALSILLLAGFQVGALWVTMAPFVAALLISFVGGWLAFKEGERLAETTDWLSLRALWRLRWAFTLALAATFIYQPWAMFYLLPACAYLIFTPLGAMRKTMMVQIAVGVSFFLAITTYFILHRYLFLPYLFAKHPQARTAFEANPMFAFKVTSDIQGKLTFFFHDILLHAANLWNIYLSNAWALTILGVIVAGGVATFLGIWRRSEQKVLKEAGFRIVFLAALAVGTVLPVVVAAGGHSGFRVVVPLAAMIILMLGGAALAIGRLFKGRNQIASLIGGAMIWGMCIVAAAQAWGNVRDSALNASQEYLNVKAFLREYLADKSNGNSAELHFALANPDYSSSLNKPVEGVGEFNINSAAFWQDVPWIIRAALLGLGVRPSQACVMPKTAEKSDVPQHCIVVAIVPYGGKP